MATIRTKLKQLQDADVRYISLVDRSATRIPFRVLKRDKENKMGIDLTGVYKQDHSVKPFISALVVFAQKNEAAATDVQAAIKTHGFIVDRVQKADDGETLVFAQADKPKESHLVRLGDQVLADVGGLLIPTGWMGDLIAERGFFPSLQIAADDLADQLSRVAKADTPAEAGVMAVMESYGEYLGQMLTLPSAAFLLEDAVADIVQKCACKDEVQKEETEEERKKRIKDHPPSEMAPCDEEDDQKPPPDAVKGEVVKADDTGVLAVLKRIEEKTAEQLATLTTKLETVITEQGEQKKVLDGVVLKADTLGHALRTTVTAVPPSGDRPVGDTRMRVQKDDDPRTGNFDTAFLRRRK